MAGFKYRVHEIAKDFNVNSKVILNLLKDVSQEGRNHMSALENYELDSIFEHFTKQNSVDGFDSYFALAAKEEATAKKELPPAQAPQKEQKTLQKNTRPPQQTGNQSAQQQHQKARASDKVVRYVDTKTVSVDLNKFDERIDAMVPEKAYSMDRGKQKIKKGQKSYNRFDRAEEEAKLRRQQQLEKIKKTPIVVQIPEEISVGELASRMKMTAANVIKKLMTMGVMASASEIIDFETAALVADELGAKVEKEVVVTIEEKLIDTTDDTEENLKPRSPVVVVMGHVDHGKTSLLDAIRHTNVTAGEAGGITQHIGAYRVKIKDSEITFLDTPGHEAFTAMRARGAQVTDIAILVVAADDGIMPQTIEAINHAKAAGVSIIVAINKIDKEGANPDRVKQELTEYELVPEEWGGDTICVPVSATKKTGIETLLEMVMLTAEMRELKANPDREARGTVIEARLDKGRGPIATVLVQNGTLSLGDVIIAGTAVGRVRGMMDDKGRKIQKAGPSVPVEITGFSEVPDGGEVFNAVRDEKMARELAEERKQKLKDQLNKPASSKISLEDLFEQIKQGEVKDLNIVVKADVQGSVEAVIQSLSKLSNDEVRVRVIHGGVGAINESDVMLANASNAIIVGFNVRPDAGAAASAAAQKVDMRLYRIIYEAIEEIEQAMKGMLAPKFKEVVLGHAQIRQTFKVSGVGTIAGCYVQDGKIVRNCSVRIVRDGIVIHEGTLSSLKRFKDDVKEVAESFECGLSIEKFNDIKVDDIVEAYTMEQIKE